MKEIWKDIVGYEGYYQVSNLGRIKSLDRTVTRNDGVKQFKKGIIKTPKNSTDGYDLITLSKNGENKTQGIHIIVAKHFIPNPDNLPEVNHKDFNRKNNRVDNLEWSTHQDNIKHSAEAGRYKLRDFNGANNPNYGNDTLKKFYAAHPEKAMELLARHGAQNGRSKKVNLFDKDHKLIRTFSYIGECAQYLIDSGKSRAHDINSLRDRITKASKNKSIYLNCYFEVI